MANWHRRCGRLNIFREIDTGMYRLELTTYGSSLCLIRYATDEEGVERIITDWRNEVMRLDYEPFEIIRDDRSATPGKVVN